MAPFLYKGRPSGRWLVVQRASAPDGPSRRGKDIVILLDCSGSRCVATVVLGPRPGRLSVSMRSLQFIHIASP
jgi:hypothetical protein